MTSKQRAYLRSLASEQQAIIQIGKDGITENVLKTVDDALEARELIKITVLESCEDTAREAAETLSAETEAQVVTVIGRRVVLYRESEKHKKIDLKSI